jgi:hypothetical protein
MLDTTCSAKGRPTADAAAVCSPGVDQHVQASQNADAHTTAPHTVASAVIPRRRGQDSSTPASLQLLLGLLLPLVLLSLTLLMMLLPPALLNNH